MVSIEMFKSDWFSTADKVYTPLDYHVENPLQNCFVENVPKKTTNLDLI